MNSRPTILGIALVLLAGFAVAPTVAKEKPAQEIFETDINSAAHGDLTELPGITDAIAERIIAERPFKKKSDLVQRKILTKEQYRKVKKLIVALPAGAGAG